MSGREDGLPKPYTADQEYLAAILDELRGLSALLSPPAPAEVPAAKAEPAPELVQLREPEMAVFAEPTEAAAAALADAGITPPPKPEAMPGTGGIFVGPGTITLPEGPPNVTLRGFEKPPKPVASRALPTPDPALDGDTVVAAAKVAKEAAKIRARQAAKRTRAK